MNEDECELMGRQGGFLSCSLDKASDLSPDVFIKVEFCIQFHMVRCKGVCLGFVHPRWLRLINYKRRFAELLPLGELDLDDEWVMNRRLLVSLSPFQTERSDGTVFTTLYNQNLLHPDETRLFHTINRNIVEFEYIPELDPDREVETENWCVRSIICSYSLYPNDFEEFYSFCLDEAAIIIQKAYRKHLLKKRFRSNVLPSVECLATFRHHSSERVDLETLEWWRQFNLDEAREELGEVWGEE